MGRESEDMSARIAAFLGDYAEDSSDDEKEEEEKPQEYDPKHIVSLLLGHLAKQPGTDAGLKEEHIIKLCQEAQEMFMKDPMVLRLESPIKICGDLHGQFYDLLRLFEHGGYPGQGNSQFVFLGDYVDRGKQSVETMCLLLAFKVLHPTKLHLLRGNHETATVNRIYGFYDECKRRYSLKLYKAFTNAFNCMPMCAIISETILCMHGGLSPDLTDFSQIDSIQRPCEIPEEGILCDLMWADPDPDVEEWEESDRGVSYLFGEKVVKKFLKDQDLELMVRAHQVVEDGYEFFANRQLVTIFSAPNYCGSFDNAAAMMIVEPDLTCSFQLLKPVTDKTENFRSRRGEKKLSGRQLLQSVTKKVITSQRFGRVDLDEIRIREKDVDRKSFLRARKSRASIALGIIPNLESAAFSAIQFREDEELAPILEIEDLTVRNTSWGGDLWDDLFYDDDALANCKYEAFMDELEEQDDMWS